MPTWIEKEAFVETFTHLSGSPPFTHSSHSLPNLFIFLFFFFSYCYFCGAARRSRAETGFKEQCLCLPPRQCLSGTPHEFIPYCSEENPPSPKDPPWARIRRSERAAVVSFHVAADTDGFGCKKGVSCSDSRKQRKIHAAEIIQATTPPPPSGVSARVCAFIAGEQLVLVFS